MTKLPPPIPMIDSYDYWNETAEHVVLPSFAKQDLPVILDFLNQYSGNKATFESYRREVERLLQWSWSIAKKSIFSLKRQDLHDYISFCLNPPKSWIGLKRVARFINQGGNRVPNPHWRPFVAAVNKQKHKKGNAPDKNDYQLSQKAIREIFTILGSFYNYSVLEEKIANNPISLIRQKSRYLQKRQTQLPVKRLNEKQWQCCLETAEQLAQDDPAKYERTLFIISALYLLYLRISELTASERWSPQMKHFYQDSNQNWWFKTVGKGNKARDIAVSISMLNALKRYREKMGLPSLPALNETFPLLQKEKGKGAITSSRHIRRLVQECFDKAVEKLRKQGASHDADALEMATVHWLRHTGISDDINKRGRPVAHVRDDAGHSSSAITDRYNDIELLERHKSAEFKKLKIPHSEKEKAEKAKTN